MKKGLSILLAVVFTIFFNSQSDASNTKKILTETQLKERSAEIASMRKEDCRFYKNDDGTITAVLDVKKQFPQGGSLAPAGKGFENSSGRFKAKFPREMQKEAFTFSFENTSLSMELKDHVSVSGFVYGDTIKYPDIMRSTDLIYQVLSSGVKETIVLKDGTAPDRFNFEIKASNLLWTEKPGGRIDFSSKDSRKPLFYLSPVYAVDCADTKLSGITQSVRRDKDGLILDIHISRDILSKARYPVSIDPSITLYPFEDEGMDTYIGGPYSPYRSTDRYIYVGYEQYRGLIKFNLSSIPRGTVTSAGLSLFWADYIDILTAYRVTQEWLEAEANWNEAKSGVPWTTPGGAFDPSSGVQGFGYYLDDPTLNFNITSLVNGWVNGTIPNYGVLLKTYPGDYGMWAIFSSNNLYADFRPHLYITYTPDTTPPTVSITSPASGSTVTGTVNVSASAQDDMTGVQKVEFYVGSSPLGSKTSSPYQLTWNTAGFSDGQYRLWAKAYDNAGNAGASDQNNYLVNASNPPLALPPSGLTVQSTTDGKINLNWTASPTSGVTYRVYRGTSAGFTPSSDKLIGGGFSAASYLDGSGLVTGTTYYYKVTAVAQNGVYESSPSNEAGITCGAGPQAPVGLGATPGAGGDITLTWNPSVTPGVTYRIYRNTVQGFAPSAQNLLAGAVAATTYSDSSGLVSGTSYYYRVTSFTPGGAESLPSNEAGAMCGGIAGAETGRVGIRRFWTYAGLPLGRGDGMVNMGSGNLAAVFTDSLLPGNKLASEIRRTYNSLDKTAGALGYGWSLNILQSLTVNPDSTFTYSTGDGYKVNFSFAGGSYQAPAGIHLTLVKNPDGSFTITRKDNIKYIFDPTGRLLSIRDLNNNTITYGYTGNLLTSVTDTVGRVTTISYDGSGRVGSIRDQRSSPTVYGYDASGNLVTVTDPMGYVTRFYYDSSHNLTEVNSPAGTKTRLNYDAAGHLTAMADGLDNTTTISWNFQAGQAVLTNPRGNSTTYTFNPSTGVVSSIVNPLGGTTAMGYDGSYNLTSITDPGGHATSHTYDGMGNMLTKSDAAGTLTVTCNAMNLPVTVTAPNGGVTRFYYDGAGNLTQSTDPMNYTTTYQNDAYGRRISTTDPGGGVTTYQYDTLGNLSGMTDADNNSTSYTYNSMGDLVTVTDPAGAVTRYTYDDLGRLVRTDYPDGSTTSASVDGDSRVTAANNANGGRTIYGYDAAGRVTTITDPRGYVTTYQYDRAGNREKVTDPEGVCTTFAYDALNRLIRTTDALGNATSFSYDPCGNMTEIAHPPGHAEFQAYDNLHRKTSAGRRQSPGGANTMVTTYTYDAMGNVLLTTDPAGNTTAYQYNLNNRLIRATDALNNVTTYGYDACGNRTTVTNALNRTASYTYSKTGKLKSETPPGGNSTSYSYNSTGRVSARTDGRGQTTTYTYDSVGKLTRKSYPDGTSVSYTYDGMGQRLSMTDTLGVSRYSYDPCGNLLEETDSLGRKTTYTYDRAGRRKNMTSSFGTQSYEYDAAGRLSAVTDFKGSRITIASDPDGKITTITYPQGGTATYTYNALDQMTGFDGTARDGNHCRISYQYDARGNASAVSITASGFSPQTASYSYAYDRLNRLERLTDYSGIPAQESNYTYDSLGNRLTYYLNLFGIASANNSQSVYDAAGRLASMTEQEPGYTYERTYGYDGNGNQLSMNQTRINSNNGRDFTSVTCTYDAENRLSRSENRDYDGKVYWSEYKYDGDGRLMRETSGVTDTNGNTTGGGNLFFQYDGKQAIADLDFAGAVVASYSRIPGGRLLSVYKWVSDQIGRDNYYVFSDRLGSTMMLFGQNNGKLSTYRYNAFGGGTVSGESGIRFTFTGAPYFSGPGLYQMGARYYNPVLGRFITRDTYKGSIYQPWTQNLYTYCNNNPINYIDPTGHHPAFSNEAYDRMREVPERLKNQLFHGVWKLDNEMTEYEKLVVFSPAWTFYRIGTADLPPETKQEYFDTYSEEFAMSVALMGAGGKGAGKAGAKATQHGAQRLAERGFSEADVILTKSTNLVKTQADGAQVYIKEVTPGRFNVIVESENGVVTALKNISEKSLDRLSNNYGWK